MLCSKILVVHNGYLLGQKSL